jgi:Fanconi anemia group M protein
LHLPYTVVKLLTGELPAGDRVMEWNEARVIIATPQTIENDLKSGIYTFENVSVLIIDEAHGL